MKNDSDTLKCDDQQKFDIHKFSNTTIYNKSILFALKMIENFLNLFLKTELEKKNTMILFFDLILHNIN